MIVQNTVGVLLSAIVAAAIVTKAGADVSISNKPTANMDCENDVCTATAQKAVLYVGDLQTMLASGDVVIKTGDLVKDIDIDQPLTWATTSRLTLDARQSVVVNKPVSVTGAGALTVVTNDGARAGDFITTANGRVTFSVLSSDLNINGQPYQLLATYFDIAQVIKKSNRRKNPAYFALAQPISPQSPSHHASIPSFSFGVFEGLGNAITNPISSVSGSASYVGFIGILGAEVHNVKLASLVINGYDTAGGLAGISSGKIINSSVNGQVNAEYSAGGLVGENRGLIENSQSAGVISGMYVGGLVGQNLYGGQILRSHSDASVSGTYLGGGLVGSNSDEYDCAATSLIGDYATGAVTGGLYGGGLVGANQAAQIANSYSIGAVTGSTYVGGLVGADSDGCETRSTSIQSSYATGTVQANAPVGGLIGSDVADSKLAATYWDFDTSGVNDPAQGAGNIPNDPGITGLTDLQLKSGLPAGFDPKVWGSNSKVNNGYPYLLANPPK